MAVGLVVGGWFASAFVGKLADKIRSYIGDQYEYQTVTVKDKLKSLEGNLNKIQAAVHAADQSQIENPGLKEWLLNLKDASYDAEDVLDMFEYQLQEDKAKGKNLQVCSDLASTCRKSSKRARTILKRFLFCDDDLNELLEVVDRFDKIVSEMGCFLQLVDLNRAVSLQDGEIMESRLTTSTVTESQLFGRDNERTRLIELLLKTGGNECGSSSKNVHVLPIVGIGGVGKTTLAQSVYSNKKVEQYFDLSAWVCVSDNFGVKRLMKEIIESASLERSHDFHNLQNLDSIQKILKRGLKGKRFLIVLDDVWNEVPSKWNILHSALNSGKEGSRVIITTRIQKIAEMMGTMKAIALEGLADEDYWNFFVQCAFGDENPENHPKLESIGRQIYKKLGGLPLAAKSVGSLLKSKFKEKFWRGILESKLWKDGQLEVEIMRVLELSYEHLSSHLKQCFVYCSFFPKDYEFAKNKLVRMWMAQGFIQNSEEKTMEDIGRAYLKELLSRSFFEKKPRGIYVIHDLLHDLAQYLSHDEYFIAEDNNPDNVPVEIPKRVRHSYIGADNLPLVCNNKYAKKNLRSLVVVGPFGIEVSLDDLKELKGLRVLVLQNFRMKLFPESIGRKLVHLRYLEIDVDGFDKLPESLCKLYHLQVLDCYPRTLPKGINNLINLCFLGADKRKIAGIGKLTSLQELSPFMVKHKNCGYEIGQLRDMRQLRKLAIMDLCNVGSKEEASEARLDSKKHLEELHLTWGCRYHINPDEVLDSLRPHRNLEKLTIVGYTGIKSPSWLYGNWLSNLDSICLEECPSWEVLPPLGHLPFLKVLQLLNMRAVKKIGHELYGNDNNSAAFPSLEWLMLDRMLEWEEWSGVEGRRLFPRLSFLGIHSCHKLRGPLCLPSPLKELDLRQGNFHFCIPNKSLNLSLNLCQSQNISILKEWIPLQNLSSLETMSVRISEVTSFTAELDEWFQHLTSLHTLYFLGCKNLHSLPSVLKSLSSLQVLKIVDCREIHSLPEEGLPSSLRRLILLRCNPVLTERCRTHGSDWHKIAHISNIRIDDEVVQRL